MTSSRHSKKDKKHKKHKKDKHHHKAKTLDSFSQRQTEMSQLSHATASTACTLTTMSVRESAKFKKESRAMFQKMAAAIDLAQAGAMPSRLNDHEPVPTLRDQIDSGSLLREMYLLETV